VPIKWRISYCAISDSVQLWISPARTLGNLMPAVGSSIRCSVATRNCIKPRRALSQLRAAKGFFDPSRLTMWTRCRPAIWRSP